VEHRHHTRQDQGERDEGHIAHHQIEALVCARYAGIAGLQFSGIEPFDTHHPRIAAQARMQLAMSDIHPHHLRSALLQQAIGEATGTLAHIQTAPARGIPASRLEGAFELESTARNVTRFRVVQQHQLGRFGHLVAVLGHTPESTGTQAPLHPGGDQPLRLRARGREAPFDEELVDAHQYLLCSSAQRAPRRQGAGGSENRNVLPVREDFRKDPQRRMRGAQ